MNDFALSKVSKVSRGARGSSLYESIKLNLIRDIQDEVFTPGSVLPNERELAARFNVAIGTLRRAVDDLVADGILIRQQGKGTFVAVQDRDRFMFQFFRIAARDGSREFPKVELVSFHKARATLEEALALGLQTGEPVYGIVNRLSLGGEAVILDRIVIAQKQFPDLTRKVFESRHGTIYELYQTQFGATIIGGMERVRAVASDAPCQELLGIKPGQPVLEIKRIAHSFEERPVEFRVSMVNTERFDYVSALNSSM